ncbi:MAG: radical SAM protein [Planctomycetota bacterium]
MPWTSSSCPHFLLEINQKCNISCRGCYKNMDGSSKPLDQIISELDIAMSKRRVQTVSIAGGEPTLHPQLCEIVGNLHRRNLKAVLITNGLLLGKSLLDGLTRADAVATVMLRASYCHSTSGNCTQREGKFPAPEATFLFIA